MCGVIALHEEWRHRTKAGGVDAARASDIAVSEIKRREAHMRGKMLVPLCAGLRSFHKRFYDGTSFGFVASKALRNFVFRLQCLDQRNDVFHGQPRARANGEMRGMQGIADQDHVAEVPTIVPQPREIAPDRFVGNERVAVGLPARASRGDMVAI